MESNMKYLLKIITLSAIVLSACKQEKLKIYGPRIESTIDGEVKLSDYTLPPFSFENQDGNTVSDKTLKGKIYCTDFFFTTCRSICPTVNNNLTKVQKAFAKNSDVRYLSHSLDPNSDTKEILKDYAEKLGADLRTWDFVLGDEATIYDYAQKHYFVKAIKDETALDGIDHSGRVILVDPVGRIRGYYDFTDDNNVEILINDIKTLLDEMK